MSKRPDATSPGMKPEYDFSRGERGKFYREGAVQVPPIHLEPGVLARLQARASARGMTVNALVNAILKEGMEPVDATGGG